MVGKLVKGVAMTGLALVAQTALAQPQFSGGRWMPPQSQGYTYARVVDVDPIVRRVRVSVPTQECWNESRYERGGVVNNNATSAVLGGLVGAVIGSQFGHGDGRRAATVAGALVGGAVGHEASVRNGGNYYEEPRQYDVQRCATRYEERFEERVEGYRVTYVHDGRRYVTQTAYDPGQRIRVEVNVRPVGY